MISIVENAIDICAAMESSRDGETGATVTFVGTTRGTSGDKRVVSLSYEAYLPMALAIMREIEEKATSRWGLCDLTIIHRLGVVPVGEASVLIVVRAPHRAGAFEACRYCIDEVKKLVPIWKREHYADGSAWIGYPKEGFEG